MELGETATYKEGLQHLACQFGLQSEFQGCWGYAEKPSLIKTKTKRNKTKRQKRRMELEESGPDSSCL